MPWSLFFEGILTLCIGLLCSSYVKKKKICLQCRRHGFDPWVRKMPCREGMATHSSILAWRITWTKEPDGLQSMEWQGVEPDWVATTTTFILKDDETLLKGYRKGQFSALENSLWWQYEEWTEWGQSWITGKQLQSFRQEMMTWIEMRANGQERRAKGKNLVNGYRVSMGPLRMNEDKEMVWSGERKERNAIVSSSVPFVFMELLSVTLLFLLCISVSFLYSLCFLPFVCKRLVWSKEHETWIEISLG